MPTTKARLNITLPEDVEEFLNESAKLDRTPKAKKVVELLKLALEIEEDLYFGRLMEERMSQNKGKWLTHEQVFGKLASKKK